MRRLLLSRHGNWLSWLARGRFAHALLIQKIC